MAERVWGQRGVGLLAAACLLTGCATAMVPMPGTVRLKQDAMSALANRPAPQADVGAPLGATVSVLLRTSTFRAQAQQQKTLGDVVQYYIDLVPNMPGDGGLNVAGVPNYTAGVGSGKNDYSAAATVHNFLLPVADIGTARRMQFTNVPPGTYRVRVFAFDSMPATITQPDPNVGPSGANQKAVSTNSVTVVLGQATPTYNNGAPNSGTGPQLEVHVQLQHEQGDPVASQMSVSNGNAIPSVGSGNGTI